MDYIAVIKTVREEFERKVAGTELETYPCRGGYLVRGWGNEGRNIRQELEQAGLPFDMNLSGTYIVSSWAMERDALSKALEAAPDGP